MSGMRGVFGYVAPWHTTHNPTRQGGTVRIYFVALSNPGANPPVEFTLVGEEVPGIPPIDSVVGKSAFMVIELLPSSDVPGSTERYARMCEGFSEVELDILKSLTTRAAQVVVCVMLGSTDFADTQITERDVLVNRVPRELEISSRDGILRPKEVILLGDESSSDAFVMRESGEVLVLSQVRGLRIVSRDSERGPEDDPPECA